MKNNRKERKLNKAERLARKGLIGEIILVYSTLFILMALFVVMILLSNPANKAFTFSICLNSFKELFAIPLLVCVFTIPIYWFFRKQDHINFAYKKVSKDCSKKLAERYLIPGEPVAIELIDTRDGIYKDFILGLSFIADFYAVLSKDDDLISIYAKIENDSSDSRLLDIITKEEFTTYCELLGKP